MNFIINEKKGAVDVLDATDPANPTLIDTLTAADVAADAVVNSIAYKGGYLAVAIEASPKTDNGFVALYDATTLELLGSAQVVVEWKGLRMVCTGDYKRRRDPTCRQFEPVPDTHVFISEATFGLPVFKHPDTDGEIRWKPRLVTPEHTLQHGQPVGMGIPTPEGVSFCDTFSPASSYTRRHMKGSGSWGDMES